MTSDITSAGGLASNPYFSAGSGLIAVTAGLALLRQGAKHGASLARRHFLVTLEIPSKDAAYPWVLSWLSAQREASMTSTRTSPSLLSFSRIGMSHHLAVETTYPKRDDHTSTTPSFVLAPGPGTHYFRYKRAWFKVDRQREKAMVDLHSGTPWETLTFTTLARDRPLLASMLADAAALAQTRAAGRTTLYTACGPEWRPFGRPRARRALASVVLDRGVADALRADMARFAAMRAWYADRGIPYRRGYLLHGPPGGGKSSFVRALAGCADMHICVLNLGERGMTDDRLAHLLANTPPRCVVLLEDVDAAFPARDARQGYMLTFSGLLNALDGVASAEERIVFMTTNHVERLDPALVRPGRVDVKQYIGPATPYQIREIFLRFYGLDRLAQADAFVDAVGGGGLASNPYFSAGSGLIAVTAGLALLRQGAKHGASLARRHFLVTLEIPSKDAAYPWVLSWLSAQREASMTSTRTSPSLLSFSRIGMSHHLAVETTYPKRDDHTSTTPSFVLAPGPGTHYFRYKRAWFKVDRQREKAMVDLHSGTPWETLTFTTLARDRPLLASMLADAAALAQTRAAGRTTLYTACGPEWRPFGRPRARRALASVVLDRGVADALRADMARFAAMRAWYADRGIPYRRGYLLHGPPGGGKSSFVRALAGCADMHICVLNLGERGMTDDRLAHLLANTPPRCVVLLEDVDAAFPARDARQGYMLTFSGLLNALDGVASAEERIVFMTTNHVERLDPALVRPGRVDVKQYIGPATPYQIREIFLRFYGLDRLAQADAFVDAVGGGGRDVSMAQLQGHFVLYQDDPGKAIENAGRLFSDL
ncbi:hypothetical protein SeMB42_g05653 [Synchytrium endobioticum]|uniref:AAA+ ATPase domain-containing protein n=1 Tax=Synchytrium endobioticum TaxID=286115 RepID=A0A507CQ36_9FUNG|nr:hypothetical protein SeMB42_g05653 [Synchytrium endobioticum]